MYQQRYGNLKKYKKKAAIAHSNVGGKCCCCKINDSQEIHHSSYRKSGDRYGINIFPVCKYCHKNICHSTTNWLTNKDNPVWKNKNTPAFTKMLQRNYKQLHKKIR